MLLLIRSAQGKGRKNLFIYDVKKVAIKRRKKKSHEFREEMDIEHLALLLKSKNVFFNIKFFFIKMRNEKRIFFAENATRINQKRVLRIFGKSRNKKESQFPLLSS